MKNNDPFTREDQTRFTMRIDSSLLDRIKQEAERNKRSTAKEIEFILDSITPIEFIRRRILWGYMAM